jgi:glycosyltransferase involved in cell wall biosynthesis
MTALKPVAFVPKLTSTRRSATALETHFPNKPETVLILETNHTGHHLRYVALMTEAFRAAGLKVVLASTKTAFQSEEYAALMLNCDAHVQKLEIPQTFNSGSLSDLEHVYRLLRLMAIGKADLYFVPFLATIYSKLGLLGVLMKFVGLPMPPIWGILLAWSFAYEKHTSTNAKTWREQLWQKILERGPFHRVFIVDEIAYDYISKQSSSKRLIFSPEPIERFPTGDVKAWREAIGIPQDAKVIGAFGCLRRSKGVQYLLEAFQQRNGKQKEYMLVMGPQDNEIKEDFASLLRTYPDNRRIVIIERFLSETELQQAFCGVDIIAVNYLNICSTPTMLLRAAAAGKPVLGANDGWIGQMMSKYRLGVSCDANDVPSLIETLDKMFQDQQPRCPDAQLLAERYACEHFMKAIINELPKG